jgi:pimeloyl-ACP methyl ester carboxylesterase
MKALWTARTRRPPKPPKTAKIAQSAQTAKTTQSAQTTRTSKTAGAPETKRPTKAGTGTWDVREAGPATATLRVLLIPGGMCTTEFYADVMAEPALGAAGLRLIAVTLPGFGPTTPPADVSMENYARLMAGYAHDAGCQVVVGHSLGANVALEMAATGLFKGPVVLLSPAFSYGDESTFLAIVNQVGRVPVLGTLIWAGLLRVMPRMVRSGVPAERAQALAEAMSGNDPRAARRIVRAYYEYLAVHRTLTGRLCAAGVPAWVVRGDHDEIGLRPTERRSLETCPTVTTVTVPDAGHAVLVEQPAAVAEVILEAVAAVR